MSENQAVKIVLSASTEKNLDSLQRAEELIDEKNGQIENIDILIEGLQDGIDQLKKTPELSCIDDRVEQIIKGQDVEIPRIDVRERLEREALVQQKLELIEGLKNKREVFKNELDKPDNTAFRIRQKLPRDLAEDWVESLSDQDRAIYFYTLQLMVDAKDFHVKPFTRLRQNDDIKTARKALLKMAGR